MKKILIPSIVVVSFLFGVAYLYAADFSTIKKDSSKDAVLKTKYCRIRENNGTYLSYDEFLSCQDYLFSLR